MDVNEAIKKRRSIRSFQQRDVSPEVLKELLAAARLAPSAANIQPLKYLVVVSQVWLDRVFNALKWAAYIAPEGTPVENQRPKAYIIILVDKREEKIPAARDIGAAVENMLLLAVSKGLASCWIGAVDKEKLAKELKLTGQYYLDSVIALGYPAEKSTIESWQGSLKYFKDAQGRMRVPKRNLEDLILEIK